MSDNEYQTPAKGIEENEPMTATEGFPNSRKIVESQYQVKEE